MAKEGVSVDLIYNGYDKCFDCSVKKFQEYLQHTRKMIVKL